MPHPFLLLLLILEATLGFISGSRLRTQSSSESRSTEQSQTPRPVDKGALITVDFSSTVGVLLDDYPLGNGVRERAAAYYANASIEAFWKPKAKLQTWLMAYRQVFRRHFFPAKKALTMPPVEKWTFTFSANGVQRTTVGDHDYLALNFTFHSVLVSDVESIGASEPALTRIGGSWTGNWTLPMDPQDIFQRTRYACMDEAFFPRGSVFSENAWFFFNDFCDVEAARSDYDPFLKRCHWTEFPQRSCIQAIQDEIGAVVVNVTWQRIAYSESIAEKWRFGEQSSETPDLVGIPENLETQTTVAYRYFSPESCAIQESCIRKPGWRKLLRFTASQKNIGRTNLHLGNVTDPIYQEHNIFEYHSCHDHYHFKHYSSYQYGSLPGQKTGFCLFSTWRYNNNENVPLNNEYDTCVYQGIAPGWGDDYVTGLDCQWIDVTEMQPGEYSLSETLNPDNFLCEGVPKFHAHNDSLRFTRTEYVSDKGEPVSRVECDFSESYAANNFAAANFTLLPLVSMVTSPCPNHQSGPVRDCDFTVVEMGTCEPGQNVSRKLHNSDSTVPVVVRICEFSHALNVSTACEFVDSLANQVVRGDANVEFNCPVSRDAVEVGGAYSILAAPLLHGDNLPQAGLFLPAAEN